MTRRTYQQHCALARALDVVGERWTLLILRDLMSGPKRYKELLEGLPGIGTNLLADRLKRLLKEGLVQKAGDPRRESYKLTETGLQLEAAIVALARFGATRLGSRTGNELWRATWTPLAMKATFRPEQARHIDEVYAFRIDEEEFWVQVCDGSLKTGRGPRLDAQFHLECDGDRFLEFASGQWGCEAFTQLPNVDFQGSVASLATCSDLFGLPSSEPPP